MFKGMFKKTSKSPKDDQPQVCSLLCWMVLVLYLNMAVIYLECCNFLNLNIFTFFKLVCVHRPTSHHKILSSLPVATA